MIPYPHFWSEQPEVQGRAWRPTDEVRRRLMRWWTIQGLLLAGGVALGILIARESKRMPPIYAGLPNGVVFQTVAGAPQLDRIARMALVNDVLQILYYQEGNLNYLDSVSENVKPQLLAQFRAEME